MAGVRLQIFHWHVPPTPISCEKKETFSHMCTHVWSPIWNPLQKLARNGSYMLGTYIVWNTGSFGVERHTWPDRTRYLQLSWGLRRKRQKTFRWLNRTLGNVIIYTTVQKFGVGKILQGILSPTILPSLPKCHQKPCETLHCCLCWRLFGRSAWKEMCWRNRPWQCGP